MWILMFNYKRFQSDRSTFGDPLKRQCQPNMFLSSSKFVIRIQLDQTVRRNFLEINVDFEEFQVFDQNVLHDDSRTWGG